MEFENSYNESGRNACEEHLRKQSFENEKELEYMRKNRNEQLYLIDDRRRFESTYYYDLGYFDGISFRPDIKEEEEVKEDIEELEDHTYCKRRKPKRNLYPNAADIGKKHVERHTCTVCFELQRAALVRDIYAHEEKMLIMVSRVLQGMIIVEKTNVFMKRRYSPCCHFHFFEAIDVIYKFLNIEKHSKIVKAETKKLEKLMEIVRKVYAEVSTIQQLDDVMYRFQAKYWDFMENCDEITSTPEPLKPPEVIHFPAADTVNSENNDELEPHHYCIYCSELQPDRILAQLTTQKERLVILYLLRGFFTFEQARSQMKKEIFICHSHFSQIIQDVKRIMRFPMESVRVIMVTINALCQDIDDDQFYEILDFL
uniref:C2H2-type domain-containing protein n=1 Tax=Caenorhabditis tropicalis TaxID=1561998 RepID=A0A1I7SZD6_9PELO